MKKMIRLILAAALLVSLVTAALTGGGNAQSGQGSDAQAGKAFRLIRDQLLRQREWLGKGNA